MISLIQVHIIMALYSAVFILSSLEVFKILCKHNHPPVISRLSFPLLPAPIPVSVIITGR